MPGACLCTNSFILPICTSLYNTQIYAAYTTSTFPRGVTAGNGTGNIPPTSGFTSSFISYTVTVTKFREGYFKNGYFWDENTLFFFSLQAEALHLNTVYSIQRIKNWVTFMGNRPGFQCFNNQEGTIDGASHIEFLIKINKSAIVSNVRVVYTIFKNYSLSE